VTAFADDPSSQWTKENDRFSFRFTLFNSCHKVSNKRRRSRVFGVSFFRFLVLVLCFSYFVFACLLLFFRQNFSSFIFEFYVLRFRVIDACSFVLKFILPVFGASLSSSFVLRSRVYSSCLRCFVFNFPLCLVFEFIFPVLGSYCRVLLPVFCSRVLDASCSVLRFGHYKNKACKLG